MQNLASRLRLLLPLLFLLIILLFPFSVSAADTELDPFQNLCGDGRGNTKLCQQSKEAQQDAVGSRGMLGPNGILTKITQLIVYFTGAVSILMVTIGGFKYAISAGDSNGIQSAKNTILYSLVGLVVAISAQVIVSFVLSRL